MQQQTSGSSRHRTKVHLSGVCLVEVTPEHADTSAKYGPSAGAIKWWIGNAAEDGRWATVFARLMIPNEHAKGGAKDYGVHAFICPLRSDDGSLVSGVEIRDCGYKVGLNGVDNGAIAFHSVRVPRENLLDKFAAVRSLRRRRAP
jgi:acyl-CoA oxidase